LEKLVSQGIASTTAIANIPQVDQDKTFAVGVGVGSFNSQSAVAVGATFRPMPNAVLKASVGTGGSGGKVVFGAGAAMSF
jgi:autotransporter adhesin